MSAKTEATQEGSALDTIKLILAAAVLVGGVYGYYYYETTGLALPLRVLMVLAGNRCRYRHRDDQHARQTPLALHPGFARRDSQGCLADANRDDADGNRRFRVHDRHGAVFLGLDSGLLWITRQFVN